MSSADWYATAEWCADWDDVVQAACNLSIAAHAGQTDKAGKPYFTAHVHDVVGRLSDDAPAEVIAVAYLHDVLEDTDVTEARIRDRFGPIIADAVMAITHRPHEPRDDYYARVKADPIALRVKLADIASNTDPERCAMLDDATRERLRVKYAHAMKVLVAS